MSDVTPTFETLYREKIAGELMAKLGLKSGKAVTAKAQAA